MHGVRGSVAGYMLGSALCFARPLSNLGPFHGFNFQRLISGIMPNKAILTDVPSFFGIPLDKSSIWTLSLDRHPSQGAVNLDINISRPLLTRLDRYPMLPPVYLCPLISFQS